MWVGKEIERETKGRERRRQNWPRVKQRNRGRRKRERRSVRMVLPIGLTLVPLILLLGWQILRQVTEEGVCQTRIRGRISSTIETGTRTEVYRNRYQARWSNDSDNGLIKDLRMSKGWRKFQTSPPETIQLVRLAIVRVIAGIRFYFMLEDVRRRIMNWSVTIMLEQRKKQPHVKVFLLGSRFGRIERSAIRICDCVYRQLLAIDHLKVTGADFSDIFINANFRRKKLIYFLLHVTTMKYFILVITSSVTKYHAFIDGRNVNDFKQIFF